MHRGLLDRVLVAPAAVAVFVGLVLTPSARAALSASPATTPAGWSIVPSPALPGGELAAVSALNANEAWAVGTRGTGGSYLPLAEHWNGSQWSSVAISGPGNFNMLRAVSVVSSSDVWAVGVTESWGALIEHWNGSSWTQVSSPVSGAQTLLYGVKAFAANDVWAVGENGQRGLALHFDGTRWTSVPLPEPAGSSRRSSPRSTARPAATSGPSANPWSKLSNRSSSTLTARAGQSCRALRPRGTTVTSGAWPFDPAASSGWSATRSGPLRTTWRAR